MVSPQPILSFKYFQFRKNTLPEGIKCLFYLSWEDALWDILSKKNVKKGSCILVPDFYCGDVEMNVRLHGYKLAYYKINDDLTADKVSFLSEIVKNKPEVIVVFHPVGIKSNLLTDPEWLTKVTGKSILIEDSVHRTIDPKELNIFKKNHFIVDSLRKVVPVQGSRIYGRKEDLNFNPPHFYQALVYSIGVNTLWFLMVLSWTLSNYLPDKLAKKIVIFAEKIMLAGYDLIGNSFLASKGSVIGNFFINKINIDKIQEIKKSQVEYYEKILGGLLPAKLSIPSNDKKHLRGYPVIFPEKNGASVLNFLRSKGLFVRFELDSSNWCRDKKIIYLPLGLYMTKKQQISVSNLVKSALLVSVPANVI